MVCGKYLQDCLFDGHLVLEVPNLSFMLEFRSDNRGGEGECVWMSAWVCYCDFFNARSRISAGACVST